MPLNASNAPKHTSSKRNSAKYAKLTLDVRNTTRQKTPRVPFSSIAHAVLGHDYELSLVLVGNTRSRSLNRLWRGKDKPANVLAFALTQSEGEIFLNLDDARTDTQAQFLFIHALFHLKGLRHGSIMEQSEMTISRAFPLTHGTEHHHRHRRGNRISTRGGF